MNIIIPLSIASLFLVSCKPGKSGTSATSTTSAIPYPLDTCPVSGEKFCCKSCMPKFEKEPAKYLAKLM